jgi:hypothetical protein
VCNQRQHPLVATYDRRERSVGLFAHYRHYRNSSGWRLVQKNLDFNYANWRAIDTSIGVNINISGTMNFGETVVSCFKFRPLRRQTGLIGRSERKRLYVDHKPAN